MDHTTIAPAAQTVRDLDAAWADHDDYGYHARGVLIWVNDDDLSGYNVDLDDDQTDGALVADLTRLHTAYRTLLAARAAGYDETITSIALSYSLCPMHFGDYASCFDDDVDECRAVRMIHPLHDT